MSQKVLVVDDDERFGESLANMLKFLDFDPTVCTTAQQALNLTSNCQFNYVFSDIRMPGMNGFEFHRFLATVNQALAKRVIFLTGDMSNPDTRHMVEKTQVVCIEKPVTFDLLERAIAEVRARINRSETSSCPTQPLSRGLSVDPQKVEKAQTSSCRTQPLSPALSGGSAAKADSAPGRPETTDIEQEFIDLENAWNEALVNANSQAFDSLVADTCIYTLPNGGTLTKAEMQLTLRSGEGAIVSAKTDDIKVWVYGNTAIVNARCTVNETLRGQAMNRCYRFTHAWVREGRTWRCIASHESKIEQL